MSAAVLREAAGVIREAWSEAAERSAVYAAAGESVGTIAPTMVALADLLESTADQCDHYGWAKDHPTIQLALQVARAYLGVSL